MANLPNWPMAFRISIVFVGWITFFGCTVVLTVTRVR